MKDLFWSYREVLLVPGARSLLLLSLLARSVNIPIGAILTVIAYEISLSWTVAAAAGGLTAASAALSFWLSGKAIDVWGQKKILLALAPGSFVPLIFLLEPHGALLFGASAAVGLLRPPSGTAVRTSWQRLITKNRIQAYGIDASLAPVAGSVGSLLGALLLGLVGNAGVVLFLVGATLLSTVLLARHKTSEEVPERAAFALKEKTRFQKSVWLVIVLVGLSWGGLVGLELLVGSLFGAQELLLATALGGFSVALGALLNGLARDPTGKASLTLAATAAAASLALIALTIWTIPLLAIPLVIIFGLARGMISASGSTYLSFASPPDRRSEALSLYGSGVLTGQALYRPLAGAMLLFAPALVLLLPAGIFLILARLLYRSS